jgi:hypothetical protein
MSEGHGGESLPAAPRILTSRDAAAHASEWTVVSPVPLWGGDRPVNLSMASRAPWILRPGGRAAKFIATLARGTVARPGFRRSGGPSGSLTCQSPGLESMSACRKARGSIGRGSRFETSNRERSGLSLCVAAKISLTKAPRPREDVLPLQDGAGPSPASVRVRNQPLARGPPHHLEPPMTKWGELHNPPNVHIQAA